MRFIVTGGRDYRDADTVLRILSAAYRAMPDAVLVHGAEPNGADTLCADTWEALGGFCEPHPADWVTCLWPNCTPEHRKTRQDGSTYCPVAGFARNQEMADLGAGFALAFPGGNGTADMKRRLASARILTLSVSL